METSNMEKETSVSGPMTRITISIDHLVYQKIDHWVQKATGEVSGLGKVVIEDGVFRVVDAVLLKQENTAASTELDGAAVAKAMFELRETPGSLNFWWHSHVHMSVFWSGTDIDTIREIGRHGYVVSTVFNKKKEFLSAVYVQAREGLPEIFLDAVPTDMSPVSAELKAQWDKDFDDKCTAKTWTQKSYGYYGREYHKPAVPPDFGGEQGLAEEQRALLPPPIPDGNVKEPKVLNHEKADFQEIMRLGEDMMWEEKEDGAKQILGQILLKINDLASLTEAEKASLRLEYLQQYREARESMEGYIERFAGYS